MHLPPLLLAEGGLLYAFNNSTIAGQAIILFLLLASGLSWTVIIVKFNQIHLARKHTLQFLHKFRATRKPLTVFLGRDRFPLAPAYQVYQAGCRELCYHVLGSTEIDDTAPSRLAEAQKIPDSAMNAVRSSLERAVGEESLKLETHMILLATVVAGGPFLGLLGTVWGVMDAFTAVALAGKASLATLAPGMSASLLTTIVGLLVAIPAMFAYNYLVVSLRGLTVELDNFAAELAASLSHRFVE